MRIPITLVALGCALLAPGFLGYGGAARAQADGGCGDSVIGVPIANVPLAGDRTVPLNASLRIFFADGYGARFGMETTGVEVFECSDGCECEATLPLPVPGVLAYAEEELVFRSEWRPDTGYLVRASGIDGPTEFDFCTARQLDNVPPVVSSEIAVSIATVSSGCAAGQQRVTLQFPPASDTGSRGLLHYRAYLTRFTGLLGPRLVDRVENYAADRITMTFDLEAGNSAAACVAVVAVDSAGNVSETRPETCFSLRTGVGFAPACRLSGERRPGPVGYLLLCAGLLAFWRIKY